MQNKFLRAGLLCAAGLLSACQSVSSDSVAGVSVGQLVGGSTKSVQDVQPVGGFLPNPSLLQPGGKGDPALVYRNSNVNLSSYSALILDPVTVWTGYNSAFASLPEASRQALANQFTADLAKALKAHCRMTTQSGPGTARLRFALVGANEPNAALNTFATYVPYVSTAYGAASYLFNNDVGYFAGTATVEGYATDTSNGAVLWQAVDERAGQAAAVENTLNTRLDIDHAFEAWSNGLVTKLQHLGVCNS
jgi:hypothetical protein